MIPVKFFRPPHLERRIARACSLAHRFWTDPRNLQRGRTLEQEYERGHANSNSFAKLAFGPEMKRYMDLSKLLHAFLALC